jgi:hypothetical protein
MSERKSNAEMYTLKQEVLKNKYSKWYDAWNDEHHDDRAVYCAIYEQLMEACEAMKSVENNSICVAFNRYCNEEKETLDRIIEVFEGREAC